MKQFDAVRAAFYPMRTDTLKPECRAAIGKTFDFYAAWLIEEECRHKGQWAMASLDARFPAAWTPEENLEIISVYTDRRAPPRCKDCGGILSERSEPVVNGFCNLCVPRNVEPGEFKCQRGGEIATFHGEEGNA